MTLRFMAIDGVIDTEVNRSKVQVLSPVHLPLIVAIIAFYLDPGMEIKIRESLAQTYVGISTSRIDECPRLECEDRGTPRLPQNA